MLFQLFAAHEGLIWWQLALVETMLFWTDATLSAWDLMEWFNGKR